MKYPKPKRATKNKRMKEWESYKRKLKKIYLEKEITTCEVREKTKERNCLRNWALSFHHRHKRNFYYRHNRTLLGEFNQTLLVCQNCHDLLENNPLLTRYYFNKLRQNYEKI